MDELETTDAASVGMDPDRIRKVEALIRDQVDSGRAPTIAACVARRGKVVLEVAHGVQRPDGPPLRIDHMFSVASITKPFTAATLMALVERGQIGLMQRIVDYLPDFDDGSLDDVLIHHLLTHTAGWDTPQFGDQGAAKVYKAAFAAVARSSCPAGQDSVSWLNTEFLKHVPRQRRAGQLMIYHTWSYALLGEIIRRVTGQSLHTAMSTHLFGPLGLSNSAVIVDGDFLERVVERDPDLPYGSAETSEFGIGFQGGGLVVGGFGRRRLTDVCQGRDDLWPEDPQRWQLRGHPGAERCRGPGHDHQSDTRHPRPRSARRSCQKPHGGTGS